MALRYGSRNTVSTDPFCSNVPNYEASLDVIFSFSVIRAIFSLGFQVYLAVFQEENLKSIIILTA